ncbi:MAG: helix-turn-helix domain-containing protein [Verrucomicrobiae bacterium]|nr:helix-turn-helix domain-containing protein [Verrucomicrobiae bacterium]
MSTDDTLEKKAWRELMASPLVREQQLAFACATGVPLTLAPASAHALADGTYCIKGCLGGHSGALCQRKLLRAEQRAVTRVEPVQYFCPSGLLKIIMPVFINGHYAGMLLAGPFALNALDGHQLAKLVGRLDKLGLSDRAAQLQTTWRFTPRLSSAKCHAAGILLRMFGKYLEEYGKQHLLARPTRASALLEKIESFLAAGQHAPVSLKEVAACVNLSPCHFCSVFKRQTGLTFSQYRMRQRLEKARELLGDGRRRVSDVAFEAGFGSIPHFNRAFRRWFGCSPSQYRVRTAPRNPGQENPNPGVAQYRALAAIMSQ